MAYRTPRRSTSRLDYALGVLVALGASLLFITLICELTGQPALLWALLTGAVAIMVAVLYRRRGRLNAGSNEGSRR